MIIDFHTHVFPEKIAAATIAQLEDKSGLRAATKGTLDALLASMEQAGVDCSVIVPVVTSPRQFEGINRYAQEINETYKEVQKSGLPKLISFGGIHPDSEDYKGEMKALKSMGFAGIKLHPDYQGVFFNDIRYKRIVAEATELDMTVVVHAGIDIGIPEPVKCTPAMSAEVIREVQPTKLVLAHLGGWKLWDDVEKMLVGSNVYLDTAFIQRYISEEQFCRIVQNHGSEKVLFATDSPWSDQEEGIKWLQGCKLSDEAKKAIFAGNARKLLNRP